MSWTKLVVGMLVFAMVPTFAREQRRGGRGPQDVSPQVQEKSSIVFQLLAPDAHSVNWVSPDLGGMPSPGEMTRNDQGIWSLKYGPVDPPIAIRYQFNVDGVTVADPSSRGTSEANGTVFSLVFVPGLKFQDIQNVPHGAAARVHFYSKVLGRFRRLHVNTPPGYEAGQYNEVPVIVGYNSDEGLSFTRERTPEAFIENVRNRFGPYAARLLAAYPPGETTVPRSARNLMRDVAFGWHTWIWARLQARTGESEVFYYYFDQHPKQDPNSPQADHGTAHGPEVSYVFQVLNDLRKPGDSGLAPADFAISDTISTYWVNFAKRGDPNGPGVLEWPQFTEQNREVMYFHDKAFPGPVPSSEGLEALDAYFAWRRTPEGEAWAK